MHFFTPGPAECSTQVELQVDSITLVMYINPGVLGLAYNKHIEITAAGARMALTSTAWGRQGNDPRSMQGRGGTHARVRFHHVVTNDIRHKRRQDADNRMPHSEWQMGARQSLTHDICAAKHTVPMGGTPPTARITGGQRSHHPTHPLHYNTPTPRLRQT